MEKNCLLSVVMKDFKGKFYWELPASWNSLKQKIHASNGPDDVTRKEQARSHPTKAFSKRDFWIGVGTPVKRVSMRLREAREVTGDPHVGYGM